MSLSKIKVSKSELLTIVRDNKKKHDEIYEAAEAGYWLEAEEYLKKFQKEQLTSMKKNYQKSVKDLKKQVSKELRLVDQKKRDGFSYMRKPFPENHSDDYQGTIRKLELCVEPEIELVDGEFDCFVRNKWTWRQSFLSTNSSYANNYAVSASWASSSISGAFSPVSYACTGSLITSLANF
jgi:hypothetical protein